MLQYFLNIIGTALGFGDDVISVVTGATGVPGPAGSLSSDQQT